MIDSPVGVAGERQERRRSVLPARVGLPYGAPLDRPAGQVRCVLPPPRGPLLAGRLGIERCEPAADAEAAEFLVEFGDDLPDLLALVGIAVGAGFLVGGVQVGAGSHQCLLPLGRLRRLADRFFGEVPAFAALGHPQPAVLVRARAAAVLPAGAAGDGDDVDPAGGEVEPPHRQRSDTHAVVFGEPLGDVAGQGEQRLLRAGELILIDPLGAAIRAVVRLTRRQLAIRGTRRRRGGLVVVEVAHAAPPAGCSAGVGSDSTCPACGRAGAGPVTKSSSCLIVSSGTQPARIRRGSRTPSPNR